MTTAIHCFDLYGRYLFKKKTALCPRSPTIGNHSTGKLVRLRARVTFENNVFGEKIQTYRSPELILLSEVGSIEYLYLKIQITYNLFYYICGLLCYYTDSESVKKIDFFSLDNTFDFILDQQEAVQQIDYVFNVITTCCNKGIFFIYHSFKQTNYILIFF